MTLNPGDPASDFTLPDQNGEPVTLSSFKGRNVVLYFYPKADTPGCTTQACGVRDHRSDYEAAGECPRNCVGTNERDVHAFNQRDFRCASEGS